VYVVDINLRKELSVEGATLEKLPTSPSLLIVESGCDTTSGVDRGAAGKKKEKKEEGSLLASLLSGGYYIHVLVYLFFLHIYLPIVLPYYC
jgi:hypothetical protein